MKENRGAWRKHLTEEDILRFREDPNIRYVDDHTIRFKFEFRVKLYEAWEKEKRAGVKRVLVENGYDLKLLGHAFINTFCKNFKKSGRPSNGKSDISAGATGSYRVNPEDNEYLLGTGKFIRGGKGITFSEEFKKELYLTYPEQSIEDGLRKAGIDPNKVGYHRIYALKRLFDQGSDSAQTQRIQYSDEIIEKYSVHPYIGSITVGQFRFTDSFYNEASFLIEIMKVDDILKLYEITPDDLSVSTRTNLKYRLTHWKKNDEQCSVVSVQRLRIQYNRYRKLTELLEERFRVIKEDELPSLDLIQKKKLCYWIQGYPIDPHGIVNISWILKKIGISHSSYYSILRDDKYGIREKMKDEQDDKDVEVIRKVMNYYGFRKGIRQIYMMMPDVTGGEHFSIKKIRRLMKKYGLRSGIREKNPSRIEARNQIETHKKENLLNRRFRLARPNTNILTDVTYLFYCGGKKLAYGSAAIDAVTGRVYDLSVSECNDMDLVMSTTDELKNFTFKPNSIFHSDQGSLYLTDTFQNEIRNLGLNQSMSRRGNCWDNAPQESFFGHFKDECSYRDCADFIDLKVRIYDYKEYFNNERHQWDRNKMTPMQYEKYLNDMSETEFNEYLAREEEKYNEMKKRSAEKAKKRNKERGV